MGSQDVVKLEIVYYAGRPFEKKKLVSRITGALLKEGAGNMNGNQIAESLDYYGYSLSHPFHLDTNHLVIYGITQHFSAILPTISKILSEPHFPLTELEAYISRRKQKLAIDLAKVDVVAYRKITEMLYGEDHPYGYNSGEKEYEEITREDLVEHFSRLYYPDNCVIFLSGRFGPQEIEALDYWLGQTPSPGSKNAAPFWIENPLNEVKERAVIEDQTTQQTAIRIGRRLFKRDHEDYAGMFVLNTILGGYFGSRLMENLREEKGLTYHIFSGIDTMRYGGYFCIGTEVNPENGALAYQEIIKELDALMHKRVGREELKMVKNYLLGNYLNMLDGPFNIADAFKGLILEGVSLNHYDDLVAKIKIIESEELRLLAKKYFNPEAMTEVIVGKTF
jgi:zinc protease